MGPLADVKQVLSPRSRTTGIDSEASTWSGSSASTRSSSTTVTDGPLRKHSMKEACFLKPSWCDVCGGVLIGNAFQCLGPCKLKCHRGLGSGTIHCHAALLGTSCEHCLAPMKQGSYKFGDLTKQICRDVKSVVKEQVLTEAVREQKKFGNFHKIKDVAGEIRRRWHEASVKRYIAVAQVLLLFVAHAITYVVSLFFARSMHGDRGNKLASLQAMNSACLTVVAQLVLALLVRFLARQAFLHSGMIHAFVKEIMYIDMYELDIDLMEAGRSLGRVMESVVPTTAVLGIAAFAAWLRELSCA